jgi:CubicO group peptidase (beta-lactamase class C family)
VTDTFAAIGPELHTKLADAVARNRLPGAVAGVVHRSELAWSVATGLANLAAGQPAELSTLFRIASITKPFTGTAMPSLVPSRMAGGLRCRRPAIRRSSRSTRTPRKLATR